MPGPFELLDALEREARRALPFWRRLTAAQLFVGSFLLLDLLGTALLLFLPGLYTGERLSLVDALFTATSAICVTGLILVDTATYFTGWGQGLILLLIQLGGLGILSFTTVIILLLGGRLSLRGEAVVGAAQAVPQIDARRLLRGVFRYTLWIEAVGASFLLIAWAPEFGLPESVWPAIFHAVSAFCNAGFSTFSESLIPLADDPATLIIFMLLIVLGGLGFLVIEDLRARAGMGTGLRLSLHARLVLVTTAVLILGGAALFAIFEWNNALAGFSPVFRPLGALFMSVTPRTAGFNTVDYGELTSASLLLTTLLMFIGGSPGSTAGGIKTTTIALLAAAAVARIRGRAATDAFRRTIPEATIQRSTGLAVFAMALLGIAILALQLTELGGVPFPVSGGRFFGLTFEAVSAFGTVGLSTGVTPGLSTGGKLILVSLMFIGRVGPLTLVASMAVAAQRRRTRFRYASEDVIVG